MKNYFLRVKLAGRTSIDGPIPLDDLARGYQGGSLGNHCELLEAVGQSEDDAKRSQGWRAIGEVIGPVNPGIVAPTIEAGYPALVLLASLARVAAVLVGLASVLLAILGFVAGSRDVSSIIWAVGSLLLGFVAVVTMLALAEGIQLGMDLESTLRKIRDRLPKS